MESPLSFLNFAVPYVLVSGSYQRSKTLDSLCEALGDKFARHNIGVVSAGGKPGIRIGENLSKTLTEAGQYDPTKMVTVFRKKAPDDELKVKRLGCSLFVGNSIDEMRNYLFTKSKVMLVVGGSSRTRDEVTIAQESNIPIIPIGMSGGVAYDVWLEYYQSGRYKDESSFLKLNNKNPLVASNAVVRRLVELIFDEKTEIDRGLL